MKRLTRWSVAFVLLSSPAVAATGLVEAMRARREPVPSFAAAELPVREYTLPSFPKTAEPCVEAARRVAADFAAATGAKVLKSFCSEDPSGALTLKVVYEGEEAHRPVSTRNAGASGGGFGAFADRAACEAGLPGEKDAFRAATGLAPVAAYCFPAGSSDRVRWSMRIDGFGTPRLTPRTRTIPVFARPEGVTEAAFTAGIKDALAAQGVDARFVGWRPTFGYAEMPVSYYGDSLLQLPFSEPVRVDSQAQCAEALAEVKAWTAAKSPAPLALFCGRSMTGWEVAWMFKDKPSLEASPLKDSFRSRSECLAARGRLVERQRTELGRTVSGAVCSRDPIENDWKAVLFAD